MVADNFCHWIITATYLKVSFETRMLLNKNTYISTAVDLVQVDRFRCCLTTFNVLISILILLIAISLYFGGRYLIEHYEFNVFYTVAINSSLVLQIGCLLAWAWTLMRLYKDFKYTDKLLPNKRIFILHGSLLTLYLFLYAL